jgi:primosomal protein N' (replication factor Y)
MNDYFVSRKNLGITSLIPAVLKDKYENILPLIKKIKENQKISNETKKIKSEKLLFQAPMEDRISLYKTLIRESFAKKKSIFFIFPNEKDILNFQELLSKGIEDFLIPIHGNLSIKNQFENVKKIITNPHPILVLGTAPYLAIPRSDFGIIILEHESSNTYKMIPEPHFDLKIFAEIYASKINAKFILADSLLSYETIAKEELDNFGEIYPLSFKINFKGKIEIPKKEIGFKILEDTSLEEIEKTLTKKENIFIFSLRKGLATLTICRDCNEEVLCRECRAPLVLYLSRDGKKRMFSCNRCKKEMNPETVCENCGGWNLFPLGIGTDTVLKEIEKKFPKIKVFKLDKEAVKTAQEAKKLLEEFEKSPGSILIGTEMALFYLKKKVPLLVIASFDSLWSIPNYKISEKIIQIITSLLEKTEKKLIIQTKNEQDPALLVIKTGNLISFIREELKDRKNLNYPPYKRFIKISFWGNKEEILKAQQTLKEFFKEYNPIVFSGFVSKSKNKYVTNALLKIEKEKWSLPEISNNCFLEKELSKKLFSLSSLFSINIDPEDLF